MKINGYTLDEDQLKPILENKPNSLIIAGAGSGKTLTLIGKIKYLLNQGYATSEEILCLSFTNETVENLKANIQKNCHTLCPVYTFHKLALTILKEKNFTIASPTLLEETITEFFASACLGNQTLQNLIYRKFTLLKKPWTKLINTRPLQKKQKKGFPQELRETAGSVFQERKSDGKNQLAAGFLNRLMDIYTKEEIGEYAEEYRKRSMVLGKRIQILTPEGEKGARALEIDKDCRLLVEYEDGNRELLRAGEIRIRPEK